MSQPAPLQPVPAVSETHSDHDVTSLYAQFSAFIQGAGYKEVVRDQGAQIAIERWPLLAELYGDDLSSFGETPV